MIIKNYRLVMLSSRPYPSKINKIEHTFGLLKSKILFKNLKGNEFKNTIREEINKL